MAIFRRLKVAQPVSDRQPDQASLLIWAQREVVLVLKQLRRVVNWAVDWLGYVGIDYTDTPGLLDDKLLVDSTMTKTKGGAEGARTLTLGANVQNIVTEVTNNPTLITEVTQSVVNEITNVSNTTNTTLITQIVEALPTPQQVSSTLYPAEVKDPNDRGFVFCAFQPYYSCASSLWDGWTETSPGIMQKDDAGPISSAQFDGVGVIPTIPLPTGSVLPVFSPLIGKTVLAFYNGSNDEDKAKSGPYIVDDVGANWDSTPGHPEVPWLTLTHARMHRAVGYTFSSQFVSGMTFRVQNGATYGGKFITLVTSGVVLGTTPLMWASSSDSPLTAAYDALLTLPQCTQLGALTTEQTFEIDVVTGYPKQFFTPFGAVGEDPHFWTRGLNRTELPTGIYGQTAKVTVTGAGAANVALVFRLAVRHADGTFSSTFISSGIWWVRDGEHVVKWEGLLAGAVSILETDELAWQLIADTDSASLVNVKLTAWNAGRPTFLTVPFEMTITGASTGRHNDMSGRDKYVASPDPSNADPCHPYSALGPIGRQHLSFPTADVAGSILTMPAGSNMCYVSFPVGSYLSGIDTAGWLTEANRTAIITLFISDASTGSLRTLVNNADVSGSPTVYPLRLATKSGLGVGQDMMFKAPGFVQFALDNRNHVWHQLTLPES